MKRVIIGIMIVLLIYGCVSQGSANNGYSTQGDAERAQREAQRQAAFQQCENNRVNCQSQCSGYWLANDIENCKNNCNNNWQICRSNVG